MKRFHFPEGFLWGASTASHQVEGNTKNQWSEWEVSSRRLAVLEKRGMLQKYGRGNFIAGIAADHYHLYDSDFALAKELGHTATRISIEWSTVEPEEGVFSEEGIQHYREVIDSITRHGMEPFVTLWHWTMPRWFYEKGGFEKRGNIRYFVRYIGKMVEELPQVKFWITLNEPEIYSLNSYVEGLWPPEKKSRVSGLIVFHILMAAHKAAFREIKRINPSAQVGIAKNNTYFEAYKNRPWDVAMKKILDWFVNFHFLNVIRREQDFIGLNHYFHGRIRNLRHNQNENVFVSDLGWELYPDAMYYVLMDLKKYHVPIYITENGLADAEDKYRPWFLRETLKAMHHAIQDGVDVRGYLHWSLMDNFEWAQGFWPRFGLIEIDYTTQARKPRPSAYVYRDIIRENGVVEEDGDGSERE